MNLFYLPNLQPEDQTAFLTEEESVHAIRVLRLKQGDMILITNGKSWFFEAVIDVDHPKRAEARITTKKYMPRSSGYHIHMAAAPTKNIGRYEWFLEKACEIGVDEITPLITFHSERQKLNLERLERVLIAAMKQSQTATLPKLNPPCEIKSFVLQNNGDQKFAGWRGEKSKGELFDLLQENNSIIMLIGPEGDFSDEEILLLEENGYILVSMGQQRLRTETAAIVACHTINLKNRNL
ncbi:MAG: 16S rRNA (uracil(1498)-N(3))-methyltransferase [Bacteroidales bacterium]|jgi:16S rRNA (uracil1498-N3)-methyltransferase|nr:16S rRNA (uracil(1498)-N(3))-methyltransferase [Bacteroidales bacterium]